MTRNIASNTITHLLMGLIFHGILAGMPLSAGNFKTSDRLSISDPHGFRSESPDLLRKRFEIYRSIGIGTLRASVNWDQVESENGIVVQNKNLEYLKEAVKAGLSLKLFVSTSGAVPKWFSAKYPDTQIRNQFGDTTQLAISIWHPDVKNILERSADLMFSYLVQNGLLESVPYLVVDLGAAREGKYPSAWNVGNAKNGVLFWCYDGHAKRNFSQTMSSKYVTIKNANAAWNTDYLSWDEVEPPQPKVRPGAMWHDVLVWYRDSKRKFIVEQMANYRRALKRAAPGWTNHLVVFIPGSHLTPEAWSAAITEGQGNREFGLMLDSEFLIQTAASNGCWLQHTGAQDEKEIRWVKQYLQDHKLSIPLWAENAGIIVPNAVNNPQSLVEVVLRNQLYGAEYINSGVIFNKDHLTPNEWFPVLKGAYEKALGEWGIVIR